MNSSEKEVKRLQLYELLGDLPDRTRKISAVKIAEEQRDSYILEKLMLDLNGIELVPAYFVRPQKQEGQAPVILYNHAHGGNYELGKDELLIGHDGLQKPPYAEEGASDAWKLVRYNIGHFETMAMRTQILSFLKRWI